MITAFYVAYTLTQYAWTNAHDNALFALMEQTAGAGEYGGARLIKAGRERFVYPNPECAVGFK